MSGTRSPSRTAPATSPADGRWPVWKLGALLYPFAAGAVAINLFMLSLMGQALGLPALSPIVAMLVSAPLGVPAAWWCARRLRSLMDEADAPPGG